ncbi:MAG: hypothetical protein JW888_18615 [Pirellulales bacterium]|nr:hypothetical protein [Pirellulales bacterium]
MAELINKLAPIVVVAAVFGWCCWPYLFGSDANLATNANPDLSALPNSLLSPVLTPDNARNPFQRAIATIHSSLTNEITDPQGAAEGPQLPNAKNETTDATKRASSLFLNGTLVHGDQRTAIINGTMYQQGDLLADVAPGHKPWVVRQILSDKVVIQAGSITKELTFIDPIVLRKEPGDASKSSNDATGRDAAGHSSKTPSRGADKTTTSLSDLIRALQQSQKP